MRDSVGKEKWWLNSEFTRETFRDLVLYQPRTGYRFSVDAFLLADFVPLKPGARVLELGAGCGVVSLLLARREERARFFGLEIQDRLARCLAQNIRVNRLEERVFAVRGDLRLPPFRPESFDVVVTNPPFYPVGRGRLSPDEEERIARHEILATLPQVIRSAGRLLKHRGVLVIIYPATRLAELMVCLKEHRLEPKGLQMIHSYPGDEGRLVRLRASKGGGAELRIEPPFFIYQAPGGPYTPEAEALFVP